MQKVTNFFKIFKIFRLDIKQDRADNPFIRTAGEEDGTFPLWRIFQKVTRSVRRAGLLI